MISASDLQRELRTLLGMIHRISPPLNSRPALFLEQKDGLAGFVAGLIEQTGGQVPKSPHSFAARLVDEGNRQIRIGSRSIPVQRRHIAR